jgi:DnaK suppressor protein
LYIARVFDLDQQVPVTTAGRDAILTSRATSTFCRTGTIVTALSLDDIQQLEARLRSQRLKILQAIDDQLHPGGAGDLQGWTNHVAEVREQAEASLLVDADIAQLRHETDELGRIDGALGRASAGTYGLCTRCGTKIAAQRLRTIPSAEMCLDCQKMFEQKRPSFATPLR